MGDTPKYSRVLTNSLYNLVYHMGDPFLRILTCAHVLLRALRHVHCTGTTVCIGNHAPILCLLSEVGTVVYIS